MLVADHTASIKLTAFDVYGYALNEGDIIRLQRGYVTLFKGKG